MYTQIVSNEPKQKTPKGLSIPIPKRKDVDDAIEKVAKSKPSLTPRRPKN